MRKIFSILAALLVMAGCDSGDILAPAYAESEGGRTVSVQMCVVGLHDLDASFTLALAAYAKADLYAIVQRAVPSSTPDSTHLTVTLGNVGDAATSVRLVLAGILRDRRLSLREWDISSLALGDTLHADLGTLRLDTYGCLQYGLFDQACIQCHGATGKAAAGLNLSAGQAEAALVDVPATSVDGCLRVKRGSPQESLLYQVLAADSAVDLHFSHTDLILSHFKEEMEGVRQIVKAWIEGL